MAASEPKKTFKLVRNIMNIKKMFKGRNRKKKKDQYDPEQVLINYSKISEIIRCQCVIQPSYLLMLIVERSLFEKIFTYLDHKSVASLELTCTVLRFTNCNGLLNKVELVLFPLLHFCLK